jgi:Tfp pilus assembly protein PilN
MIKINLIPPEYIARINRRVLIAKVVLAAVLVVAVVVMASVWHVTRAKTIEAALAKSEAEMRILQTDVDNVKAIEAKIAEVQKYLDSIASINKGRFIYTRFLQDITSDLPSTIWFNNINTTLAGNVVGVTLAVNSNSAYDLAYWINSLETSGPYSAVEIGSISVTETENGKKFTVPIAMKYTYK